MPQITLPIELPSIDLSTIVPIVALVVIAALILATLTARSIIKSKAFTFVMIAVVVVLGSSTIVGSLQAIAVLIGIAGAVTIGLAVALHRSPDVTDLLHSVVSRRDTTTPQLPPAQHPLLLGDGRPQVPNAAVGSEGHQARVVTRRPASHIARPPEVWGF